MKMRLFQLFTILALAATTAFAIEPGEKAPDFTLTDQNGKTHTLSDLAGKTVVLEWTCTKCPFVVDIYDRGVTKDIQAHFEGEKNLVYLLVDSSNFANAETAKAWGDKYEFSTPTLLDASGEVGRAYGAKRTPQVIVIDADGVVRYNGAIDDNAMGRKGDGAAQFTTDAITAVLAGKEVATAKTKAWGCSVKYAMAPTSQPTSAPAKACCPADAEKNAAACGEGCTKSCCTKSCCAEKGESEHKHGEGAEHKHGDKEEAKCCGTGGSCCK
jgi:peroxiredoxin